MRIIQIHGKTAHVDTSGVELDIALDLVEEAQVGDYVIVHAGYAIQRLSPQEAEETLDILNRLKSSWES